MRQTVSRLKVISTCKINGRHIGVLLKDIPELAKLQGWTSNPQLPLAGTVEETLQRGMRECLRVTEIF